MILTKRDKVIIGILIVVPTPLWILLVRAWWFMVIKASTIPMENVSG
ncbi:hypothetical protein LCGC14_0600980 [marine sediment metagenome]|uniref:ABC transmembrane type-1 domain-containing protein n=1 Tax=marine sediment metagenome TaxID=412755 RepID=A0A0F9RUM1_9ZZZZ